MTISLVATGGCIGKLSRYLRIHRKSSLPFDAFTADMLMDYRLFVQDEYQYVQRYTMLELKDRFALMCAAFGEEQYKVDETLEIIS